MKVLSPIGRYDSSADRGPSWQLDPSGQTIGFISNGKPNSAELLAAVQRRIEARYKLAGVILVNKTHDAQGPSFPATEEILHRLSSGAIAVLAASGD